MAILRYPYVRISRKVIILIILSKLPILRFDYKIKTAESYETNEHFLESQ